ncbi:RFFL family protein [Megaselia abdita]
MPCEKCNTQFSIFKRKKICVECRRFYCTSCLTKRGNTILCERCLIFTRRPLHKVDLLKLKPKDLIFYLQSKHISTAGCVEKEELVNLVLSHAAKNPHMHYSQSQRGSFDDGNPFDNIKQSCQTFFTKISDNLSDNLKDFNFEMKNSTPNATSPTTSEPQRSSPSSHSTTTTPSSPSSTDTSASSSQTRRTTAPPKPKTQIPGVHKTVNTPAAAAGPSSSTNKRLETVNRNGENSSPGQSGCECSDDEVISTFKKRRSQSKVNSPTSTVDSAFDEQIASGQSTNSATLPKPSETADSSGSSFEELGAVGGNNNNNSSTKNSAPRLETDNWQIVDKDEEVAANTQNTEDGEPAVLRSKPNIVPQFLEQRDRRVISRRRSDGFVFNRALSEGSRLYSPTGCDRIDEHSDDEDDPRSSASGRRKRTLRNCVKCGKSKSNIKRHVLKFAKHLETTDLSETEFKQELKEFVKFLENRAKSIDCSDTESNLDVNSTGEGATDGTLNIPEELLPHLEYYLEDELFGNDGIHVYAHNEENHQEAGSSRFDQRFLNLAEFSDFKEFEELSVKQLKEILMLNRVDYKGCCEKQELLERVNRLWKNAQAVPGTLTFIKLLIQKLIPKFQLLRSFRLMRSVKFVWMLRLNALF